MTTIDYQAVMSALQTLGEAKSLLSRMPDDLDSELRLSLNSSVSAASQQLAQIDLRERRRLERRAARLRKINSKGQTHGQN